jgi:3-carboxy-cis,cis-muconate cycloisomerase
MFHTQGVLFADAFGTEEMRGVFAEERYIEAFMETEAALARAEARAGLIPEAAAAEISETASLDYIDPDALEERVAEIDLFTVAIIETWKETIGDAGEYIHWGATSQDIADTAMVLLVREGFAIIERDLRAVCEALADLAAEHEETPIIGRTHHVHAIPMTFGLKAATWLDEVNRGLDRLAELRERLFVVEFFGAVGTLASLGDSGPEVQEYFAAELDLAIPNTAWFAARDRFAELTNVFATIAGSLAKVARNVLLLGREEIREVAEHVPVESVGSSTMPHKENPVRSERTVGLAAMIRGHANTMNAVSEAYDERDAGLWYVEYGIVPETFLYLSRALQNSKEVLETLETYPENMAANLEIHGGLVASEAVMMALAETIGRQTAHEVVGEAAMEALDTDRSFEETLRDDERVIDALSTEGIEELTDPREYTGVAETIAERTIDRTRGGSNGSEGDGNGSRDGGSASNESGDGRR